MQFPDQYLLTQIASTEGFIVAAGLIAAILYARHGIARAAWYLGAAGALMLAVIALKALFAVTRPEGMLIDVTGYAFPSGHAAGIAFLALSLSHLVRREPRVVRFGVYAGSLLFALLVGASRVAYMVHTPLQVFAGFAVGAAFAYLFIKADARLSKKR
jgi:undecaprenyl-diphosphatase